MHIRLTERALAAFKEHKKICDVVNSGETTANDAIKLDGFLIDNERVVFEEVTSEAEKPDLLAEIQAILSDGEWSPDTPEAIAELLTANGYPITDTAEEDYATDDCDDSLTFGD